MCLKSITRVIENPTLDELVGYKAVFVRKDNTIGAAYYGLTMDSNNLPVNEWLQAKQNKTMSELDRQIYNTGFHIFTEAEKARSWGVVHVSHVIQVKYRLVTYHGTEYNDEVVHIAREMYIPWPQVPIEIK